MPNKQITKDRFAELDAATNPEIFPETGQNLSSNGNEMDLEYLGQNSESLYTGSYAEGDQNTGFCFEKENQNLKPHGQNFCIPSTEYNNNNTSNVFMDNYSRSSVGTEFAYSNSPNFFNGAYSHNGFCGENVNPMRVNDNSSPRQYRNWNSMNMNNPSDQNHNSECGNNSRFYDLSNFG